MAFVLELIAEQETKALRGWLNVGREGAEEQDAGDAVVAFFQFRLVSKGAVEATEKWWADLKERLRTGANCYELGRLLDISLTKCDLIVELTFLTQELLVPAAPKMAPKLINELTDELGQYRQRLNLVKEELRKVRSRCIPQKNPFSSPEAERRIEEAKAQIARGEGLTAEQVLAKIRAQK